MKDYTTRKQRLAKKKKYFSSEMAYETLLRQRGLKCSDVQKQNFMDKELKELFAKTPEFIKDTALVITGVVIAWGFAVVIMSF